MGCQKTGYDKKTAQTVLNSLRESKQIPKRPSRVYECPDCGKWHITSKRKRRR